MFGQSFGERNSKSTWLWWF